MSIDEIIQRTQQRPMLDSQKKKNLTLNCHRGDE